MDTQHEAVSEIRAARLRWAEKRAEIDERNRLDAEELRQDALNLLGKYLPSWMPEYVSAIRAAGDGYDVVLHLPGCAPIKFFMFAWGRIDRYVVLEPVSVGYRDDQGWIVESADRWVIDGDEAVDLAASFGESWFEMQGWADRGNAEGLRPPKPEPTAWESAQSSLDNLRCAVVRESETYEALAISALVAIVEQLNLLNDTLSKMDR